ncbi:sulfotransferase [Halioxenophilus sp. WMMB6]|uniref:sulfotransferase n=1 Tax=Halioxenophilus sp. WMMB6 TaxID=3073815 RepID=UPI00295EA9E3|nr:sulfotransferase [Halioxenophilus sp. WMMB6]
MFRGYLLFIKNGGLLMAWQLGRVVTWRPLPLLRNLLLLLGLVLFFVYLQLQWLGLLLDEIIFHRYRQVKVTRPLFVVGAPRSGTTFLQRSLASDPQFTTTTLAECLLTPSITARYCGRALAWCLRPLQSLAGKIKPRWLQAMDSIHPLGLGEPEEDFLLLLPIFSCFILMVLFPGNRRLWRLAHFDSQLTEHEREIIMCFYRRMVQRHLYVHGEEKTYLAKNPSFTGALASFQHHFPDATFVACVRQPEEVFASQLSSLKPALSLLGYDWQAAEFQADVAAMLRYYFAQIEQQASARSPVLVVEIEQLKYRLLEGLHNLYEKAGLPLTEELLAVYQPLAQANKKYQSSHKYPEASAKLNVAWPLAVANSLYPASERTL